MNGGISAATSSVSLGEAAVLERLALRNFRNFERADATVPARGAIVVGRNGHGKTNLLEAVHFAHALRSVRGARDRELIRFGAEAFHIGLDRADRAPHRIRIGVDRDTAKKRVTLDGTECATVGQALGALPSVMLSPRDTSLIAGAPTERRRLLDVILATTVPRYLSALQRYRAALLRRNTVLRDPKRRSDIAAQAAVWEPPLAAAGAVLQVERARWLHEYQDRFARYAHAIGEERACAASLRTPGDEGAFIGESEDQRRQQLSDLLQATRAQDVRRGMTQRGPHRDDLVVTLGGRPMRAYGSAGQQRTAALALRLLERDTLRERSGVTPVLLLDDPFAELDAHRAHALMSLLMSDMTGQVFLAVPKAADIPGGFADLERWSIVDGSLLQANE